MTRTKNFVREDVLEKAMPLFWRKGYASTSMKDLELETGVNKSGLYSEFKDKEDIYLASLAYYTLTRGGREILDTTPSGWNNIDGFLRHALSTQHQTEGCFVTFSMRDFALFSAAGRKNILHHLQKMRSLILKNVQSKKTSLDVAEQITDLVVMFFAGLTLIENSNASVYSEESIAVFIDAIKSV